MHQNEFDQISVSLSCDLLPDEQSTTVDAVDQINTALLFKGGDDMTKQKEIIYDIPSMGGVL